MGFRIRVAGIIKYQISAGFKVYGGVLRISSFSV